MNDGPVDWMNLAEEEGTGDWITTYADLVTLLLAFFVMLFSISSLDAKKFKEIAASFQVSFGQLSTVVELDAPAAGGEDLEKESAPRTSLPASLREEPDSKLLSDVQDFVEKTRLGKHILVTKDKSRIIITVEGQVFFASGQAGLNPQALPVLDDIARIIQDHPVYRVNIKGHTDNNPIATPRFPSNWELSAIRATTVLRFLVDKGVDPVRLTATGYGEVLPLVANDSRENRARNRRVEFVLEKEK